MARGLWVSIREASMQPCLRALQSARSRPTAPPNPSQALALRDADAMMLACTCVAAMTRCVQMRHCAGGDGAAVRMGLKPVFARE